MEIIITLKDNTKLKFNRNPEDLRKARLIQKFFHKVQI